MDKHNVMGKCIKGQPLGDYNNNIRAPDLNFRIYNSIIYFIFISCNWDYEDIILQLLTKKDRDTCSCMMRYGLYWLDIS